MYIVYIIVIYSYCVPHALAKLRCIEITITGYVRAMVLVLLWYKLEFWFCLFTKIVFGIVLHGIPKNYIF